MGGGDGVNLLVKPVGVVLGAHGTGDKLGFGVAHKAV